MPQIELKTFHPGQVKAFHHTQKYRLSALRGGRRWGKSDFGAVLAEDDAAHGRIFGWFAPDYKRLLEVYHDIAKTLHPIKKAASEAKVFRTTTRGRIDFWTLEDESAGRSRSYDRVFIDEAGFTKPKVMLDIWRKSIRPTLVDRRGRAIAASNTNGIDPDNFLWQICNEPEHGFHEYHAPTSDNPYMPRDELELIERTTPPLVFLQEYKAEFVDWSGVAFFEKEKLLVGGAPVAYPTLCDAIFIVLDTAVKAGSANDGQAATFFASSARVGHPLTILDYEYRQMKGDDLKEWMPELLRRGEELAAECGARFGFIGMWIEDANAGSILLQHGEKPEVSWPVHPIDFDLVSKGKDGRAIATSPYIYQGLVKFSRHAYDKHVNFKGATRNHLLTQVLGFRVGDKDAAKRADDCFDTFCYGTILSLGGAMGV
jgi:hypothetical protein